MRLPLQSSISLLSRAPLSSRYIHAQHFSSGWIHAPLNHITKEISPISQRSFSTFTSNTSPNLRSYNAGIYAVHYSTNTFNNDSEALPKNTTPPPDEKAKDDKGHKDQKKHKSFFRRNRIKILSAISLASLSLCALFYHYSEFTLPEILEQPVRSARALITVCCISTTLDHAHT